MTHELSQGGFSFIAGREPFAKALLYDRLLKLYVSKERNRRKGVLDSKEKPEAVRIW